MISRSPKIAGRSFFQGLVFFFLRFPPFAAAGRAEVLTDAPADVCREEEDFFPVPDLLTGVWFGD